MRLLKLKHGPRVSEHSSGAVQPSVDRDAVFANHYPSQNFFEILESSVGCALLVFTFLSSSCYADPMTYTVNDGTVRDMWGDEEAEKLGHRISWKQWYDLNIDEAKGNLMQQGGQEGIYEREIKLLSQMDGNSYSL